MKSACLCEARKSHDVFSEALDVIRDFINKNASSIYLDGDKVSSNYHPIGKKSVDRKLHKLSVVLSKSEVDNELFKKGFNDRSKILKRLADMGYIDRSDDRIEKRLTIGLLRQPAYRFLFPINDL